jgi:hypothetical protein
MARFSILGCVAFLTYASGPLLGQIPVGRPSPTPLPTLSPPVAFGTAHVPALAPLPAPSLPALPALTIPARASSSFADDSTAKPAASASPAAGGTAEKSVAPPTLEELNKKVEALSKNLTVVTGDGDFKLVLGGAIVADFLYNTTRPVSSGTPFYLPPESPSGFNTRTFDAHARQTSLFGLFTGPDVFDFRSGGFVLVNFYDNTIVADRYGLLPINAFGELKNEDWRFAAGYQMDIFNPLNPTVLPFSFLGASGNAGVFRGQLRAERFIHVDDDTHITLSGGISEPIPTTLNDQLRISEDNGLPNFEGRAAIGFGPMEGAGLEAHRPMEVGVSGVYGQIRTTLDANRVVATVWGAGLDARMALDNRYGVQGETYVGQGLGTYGASDLQNINPTTFRAIRTAGFWVEGYYYWCADIVHTHIGYGVDNPANGDAGPTLAIRNETYYATTIWDVTRAFRVAFQVSYLKTAYSVLKDNDGLVFHTQFQWKF